MTNTRMDTRVELIERNLTLLEDGFSKLKTDNEQLHSKLSSIESLLHTLAKGKSITEEGEVSNQTTPGRLASLVQSALPTSPLTATDDNIMSKKLDIPTFNG